MTSPGGTPLYKLYIGLRRFGLKTGIDFEHFGLKLGTFRLLI